MSNEYKLYRIKDIAKSMGDAPFGSALKNQDYTDSGALVIQGKNIQGRVCDWSDLRYVSLDKYQSLPRSQCFLGDLIFPKVGTIGKVGILTPFHDQETYILSTNTMRLRTNEEIASSDYVYYYFASPQVANLIQALNSKSVQPVFNFTTLKNFEIPLPSLSRQHFIVQILRSLDDKIELNRQMNKTLESIAQTIFKSWFIDFDPVRAKMEGHEPYGMDAETAALFPDGFEDSALGKIPEGWHVAAIGDVLQVVGGSTPSTKEPIYWQKGTIPWATPKDLAGLSNPVLLETERCVTEAGLQQISSGLLPKGTILLSSRAPIGYLAIAEMPVAINQGFIAIICNERLSNYYVLQWLKTNMNVVVGRANGTTFLEISKANFRPIPILIPSSDVLKQFNRIADRLYQILVNNLEQIRTLSMLRDTLLPRLISGQIRIKETEKVAEACMSAPEHGKGGEIMQGRLFS